MRPYNDAFDEPLLTPGRKVQILHRGSLQTVEIQGYDARGWGLFHLDDGSKTMIKTSDIENIDASTQCWYYFLTDGQDRVAIKQSGFYLGRDDIVLGECITGTKAEAERLLEKAGFGDSNIIRLVEAIVGSNRRPENKETKTVNSLDDAFDMPEEVVQEEVVQKEEVTENTGIKEGYAACEICGGIFKKTKTGVYAHKCVPKEQPQQVEAPTEQEQPAPVKNTAITADMVISAYIATRDEIAAEKKLFEEKVADLKIKQGKREAWLMKELDRMGVTSVKKNGVGIAFFNTRTSATLSDRDAFVAWVKEDWENRDQFLDIKANKTSIKDRVDENETLPPGVNYTTVKVVQINKG
jgi:hypothetical protein